MTKLEQFRDYCEREYKDFVRAVENEWDNLLKARDCGLQRCLGVADFLQLYDDISYEDIDKIYTEYRTLFYELV